MAKKSLIKPTEEQIKFYEQIFDGPTFSSAIATVENLLKEEKSYYSLKNCLQKKFGYDNIEDIEHYHNNKYFDPNYNVSSTKFK